MQTDLATNALVRCVCVMHERLRAWSAYTLSNCVHMHIICVYEVPHYNSASYNHMDSLAIYNYPYACAIARWMHWCLSGELALPMNSSASCMHTRMQVYKWVFGPLCSIGACACILCVWGWELTLTWVSHALHHSWESVTVDRMWLSI